MKVLLEQIKQSPEECISFQQFMEIALYHETEGYYTSKMTKLGKAGDFYTSSLVHPVFSQVFTSFFHMQIQKNNLPSMICEIGGGDGTFARNVLDEWYSKYPSSYTKLHYYIIETSPHHRQAIYQNLANHLEVVHVFPNLIALMNEIPTYEGIIFSNELLDAFPVHIVEKRNSTLYEVNVTIDKEGNFAEKLVLCKNDDILQWLHKYNMKLNDGQRMEIPLQMMHWIKDIASWINKGLVITIDYGYKREEWFENEHREGSIRGYYKHQLIPNPLWYPGKMDLTSHIHIDPLIEYGNKLGIQCVYEDTQQKFLMASGIIDFLQENHDPDPFSEKSKLNRAIRSLVMPGGISSSFHVIMQGKGIERIKFQSGGLKP